MIRKTLEVACAVAAVLALQACGPLTVQSDWQAAPSHPPMQPVLAEVERWQLVVYCGEHADQNIYGCARRVPDLRACFIYTEPKPEQWLLDHERKHCAGWDHIA